MKKLAFAATVILAAGWIAVSWDDQPANDTVQHETCKAANR